MCDAKNDKYIVNGKHDADALAKLLDVFIEKFLLCGTCRNPETTMEVQKNGNIQMRCMACGEATAVDMRHRLSAFIMKNPPSATRYQKAEKAVAERQANKAGNAEGGIEGTASASGGDESEGGVNLMADVNIDAIADKAAAKKSKSGTNKDDEDFGDDWGEADFSKDAMEARRAELLGGKVRSSSEDPIDALTAFFSQSPPPKKNEIHQHIKQTAMENGWTESNTLAAVYGALFGKDILQNVAKRAPILKLFVFTHSDQKQVLYLTERLASKDGNAALKIATILNAFYEAELLEEEIILKWHKNPSKKIDRDLSRALRERTQKFVEWLQTADDEEDDEDDEDDEE